MYSVLFSGRVAQCDCDLYLSGDDGISILEFEHAEFEKLPKKTILVHSVSRGGSSGSNRHTVLQHSSYCLSLLIQILLTASKFSLSLPQTTITFFPPKLQNELYGATSP